MSVGTRLLLQAAAGNAGEDVFVDDIFSTTLYTGVSQSSGHIDINTGVDCNTDGGMVWVKQRSGTGWHGIWDTLRTNGYYLPVHSDDSGGNIAIASNSTPFIRTTGIRYSEQGGTVNHNWFNRAGYDHVVWSFKKQEKFFDLVTYTGNGTAGRTVSHDLGVVPGMIIIKRTDATSDWLVYHRGLSANNKAIWLNKYDAEASYGILNNTDPTATQITLGDRGEVNASSGTYVMYLFAHTPNSSFLEDSTEYYASNSNISGFNGTGQYRIYVNGNLGNTYYNAGTASGSVSGAPAFAEIEAAIETATGQKVRTGPQQLISGAVTFYSIVTLGPDSSPFDDEESFITCGSYEGNGSTTGPVVTLGFEPQWLLIKNIDDGQDGMHWYIFDNMRGMASGGENVRLKANKTDADAGVGSSSIFNVSPTGFQLNTTSGSYNGSGDTFIYVAIRRPNKPASEFSNTDMFKVQYLSAGEGADTFISTGFPVDSVWYRKGTSSSPIIFGDKLRGGSKSGGDLKSFDVDTEGTNSGAFFLDHNDGVTVDFAGGHFNASPAATDEQYARYFFRRVKEFYDVVTYDGTESDRTQAHNLGVAPELMIIKRRGTSNADWVIYSSTLGAGKYLYGDAGAELSSTTVWNNTSPTASVFSLGAISSSYYRTNGSGNTYIAYLYASVDGISKVGSYTGTGSDVNVDCGFSAGAKFVLVKRTDSSSSDGWFLWDSGRGIVSGNDPYFIMNAQSTGQVSNTDYIDPLNAGFTITSSAPADLNASGGTYLFLAIA